MEFTFRRNGHLREVLLDRGPAETINWEQLNPLHMIGLLYNAETRSLGDMIQGLDGWLWKSKKQRQPTIEIQYP